MYLFNTYDERQHFIDFVQKSIDNYGLDIYTTFNVYIECNGIENNEYIMRVQSLEYEWNWQSVKYPYDHAGIYIDRMSLALLLDLLGIHDIKV